MKKQSSRRMRISMFLVRKLIPGYHLRHNPKRHGEKKEDVPVCTTEITFSCPVGPTNQSSLIQR